MRVSSGMMAFGICAVLALGCGGDDSGDDDGGGSCEGMAAALVGACDHGSGRCIQYHGDRDPVEARSVCEGSTGTWSAGECPAEAKANPACVARFGNGEVEAWFVSYTPTQTRSNCEGDGGGCFVPAP